MIVTLTANPSFDRTIALPEPLERGAVHRVAAMTSQAGGKGVNISRAAVAAGIPTIAVLPAPPDGSIVHELTEAGIECRPSRPAGDVRVNLTLTEPDGTTTKLNSPGAAVGAEPGSRSTRAASGSSLVSRATRVTSWSRGTRSA